MVTTQRIAPVRPAPGGVADHLAPLLALVFSGPPPVRFECWDGSAIGPPDPPATLKLRRPDALRRMLWSPDELGLGRAFVAGDLDIDGDIVDGLGALEIAPPHGVRRARILREAWHVASALNLVGPPPAPPPEEAHVHGRRHSIARDAQAISHHYDVGNDFYAIVLGPSMTYSCARWGTHTTDLTAAQAAKHDLVCRKLGLATKPGQRLLDVGCGWGSMAIHAARNYDAEVVGITISQPQHAAACARVEEAGVADRVEIRLQDYRTLGGERFDAISSIGMFEHVGAARMARYFGTLRSLLGPGGRLLNHAISRAGGSRIGRRTFIGRYVFPDGELIDIATIVDAAERAGFEVRDVESLREHYARTLRSWIGNLERDWDTAVGAASEGRARVWRAYMAGSAIGFDTGRISVYQTLAVVPAPDGTSGIPLRRDW
jgi:cyclopropane-fatty-acyl-phospholipid synthase